MTIEKSTNMVGLYHCSGYVKGEYFIGSGESLIEALETCFEKVTWKLGGLTQS